MADKTTKELERIYTIPLRDVKSSPRNHRTDRAVRAVKNYLSHHMKSEEIWIDNSVNEKLWERGMYKIPSKIRVRALKFDDGVVEVTLPETDITTSLRAERVKAREDREAAKEKKAAAKEKTDEKKEGEEKPAEEKAGEKPAEAAAQKEPEAKTETPEKKAKAPEHEKKSAPKVRAEEGAGTKGAGSPAKAASKKE